MGRRKKMPDVKRLEGNPGKRRIDDSGVEALGRPFVPEHLCDDARGCFEVILLSMPDKVYSALDSFLLSAFAQTWVNLKAVQHELGKPGFPHVNGEGQESRWLAIHRKEAQVLASLGDRLGLDPKARAALKLPNARQQRSKFDGLIGQTRLSHSSNASLSLPASGKDSH